MTMCLLCLFLINLITYKYFVIIHNQVSVYNGTIFTKKELYFIMKFIMINNYVCLLET